MPASAGAGEMALDGSVALVTGASRGIGAATARALADAGASVALLSRDLDACEAVASAIRDAGGVSLALACDVTDPRAVSSAVATVHERLGPVDALVNNAGAVDPIGRIAELEPASFERTVAVNLHGAFYAVRSVLPDMRERRRGTIVNVSSGAAHRPMEGWVSYCTAKAGLHMLTLAIAAEEAQNGVRVFGFQPGTVDTRMQETIRASGVNPVSRMTRGQHRPPELPARVIAYLCTAEADDLCGREVSISDPRFHALLG